MTASDIATSLIPALRGQGFNAVRHPEPTPNGYGHKITLFEQAGPALGTLVIYAGKNGPRLQDAGDQRDCQLGPPERLAA